jgi:hypothetical protein
LDGFVALAAGFFKDPGDLLAQFLRCDGVAHGFFLKGKEAALACLAIYITAPTCQGTNSFCP